MQAKPEVDYWANIVTDMLAREADHKARLVGSLSQIAERLPGVRFTPKCMWDLSAEVEATTRTRSSSRPPPTYKAGFANFFDTGGRVEWAEPSYAVFDPRGRLRRLADHMRDKAALLMFLQEERSGIAAHETPVFAHPLGDITPEPTSSATGPEETFKLTGDPRVALGMSSSSPPPTSRSSRPTTRSWRSPGWS